MKVLGFMNYASHDPGACIVSDQNGQVEYITISDERLSRVKNSYFFPIRSIKYCMDYFGIKSLDEIDYICTDYGFESHITNTTRHYRKLEVDYLKTVFGFDFSKLQYINHHFAHAASTFYASGYEDAAILVVDGFGSEVETNSLFVGDTQGGIKLIERAQGQGIGIVYTAVTMEILNFGVAEEGKTMGLAPMGRNIGGEKILKLNPTYKGMVTDFSEFIDRAPYARLKQAVPKCPDRKLVTNEFYSKIAFELQEETEKCLIHLANYAYEKTGKKKLCIAGGVGLNCVANDRLYGTTPFKEIFILPAASDTGIPFGLALAGYAKNKAHPKISFKNAFTGVPYKVDETKRLLQKVEIEYKEANPKEVAQLLSTSNVVGWFVEGSEIGPRALGHRSIVADPRYIETKDMMNAKVKHREMFRPFAPSVLEEDSLEYFKLVDKAPFMLLAPYVVESQRDKIPAVVHVDGTGRVQTVTKEQNPAYYELISQFKAITGVPIVLNTSFNDNGEPIIETPLDALLCFMRTKIDYLYVDGILIAKSQITDVPGKVKLLENLRSKRLKEQYEEGVKLLCKNYSTEEMSKYLKSHYPMRSYYSQLHTNVWLQKEIHARAGALSHFVTDQYHADLMKRFMREEFALIEPKLVVIEDCYKNLEKIPEGSFVVLYNLALYVQDEKSFNFYKDLSLIKMKPLYELGENPQNDFNISNEYNSSKDWDAFYAEKILS